jgi:hypothetical protein
MMTDCEFNLNQIMISIEQKREITIHISKVGGFCKRTKGYHAVQSLLIMGEWSFQWYDESFCIQNAKWLQHIGLDVEIRDDVVKVSDEAIEKYYVNVMGLVPETQPQYNILSKRDRKLSVGKEEGSGWKRAQNLNIGEDDNLNS